MTVATTRRGPRTYEEDHICRALWSHYMARSAPNVLMFHIPNGGRRGQVEGARFRAMGVVAGMPDYCALRPGKPPLLLEVKTATGRLSGTQSVMHPVIEMAGGVVYVGHGLNECLQILEEQGVIRKDVFA